VFHRLATHIDSDLLIAGTVMLAILSTSWLR
jgi:hypothetical protein